MPKITAITKQERVRGRVNLFIDDEFAIGIAEKLLVDFDLYKGKELSELDLVNLKESESLSRCLDKAYRFLSYRPRSEWEVRTKLLEKHSEETVSRAIVNLKKYNYLNDVDFCTFWIENRMVGRGKNALSFELKNKGVQKEVIEQTLALLDKEKELENALSLIKNKRKFSTLGGEEAYKKIGGFLSRRGYSYEIIKEVLKRK